MTARATVQIFLLQGMPSVMDHAQKAIVSDSCTARLLDLPCSESGHRQQGPQSLLCLPSGTACSHRRFLKHLAA